MTSYTPSATRRGGPCEVCGKPTTRNRNRFCSLSCRDTAKPVADKPPCVIADCAREQRAKGLCSLHYNRSIQHGDPLAAVRQQSRLGVTFRGLEERFWEKVLKTPSCWIWTGAKAAGYGRFYLGRVGGRKKIACAHRVAYELLVGPIPRGLFLDHLCCNPSCVNPAHLEPVTNSENVRRGGVRTPRRGPTAKAAS